MSAVHGRAHVLLAVLCRVRLCQSARPRDSWYSQAGQDRLVYDAFSRGDALETNRHHRFFVDLAANDPYDKSNSIALEQRGWRGVCIDALGMMQQRFAASNRSCTFVRALVGRGDEGTVLFRELLPSNRSVRVSWAHQLSSIVPDKSVPTCWGEGRNGKPYCLSVQKLEERGISVEHTPMRIRSLSEILASVNAPRIIDYLSLDVEGHETSVLQGLDEPADVTRGSGPTAPRPYTLRAVTIERPTAEARQRLAVRGLHKCRILGTGLDEMYVDQRHARCDSSHVHTGQGAATSRAGAK